jgi:restriction endonuclease S subunit
LKLYLLVCNRTLIKKNSVLRIIRFISILYVIVACSSQIVRSQINQIIKGVAQKKVSLTRFKTIGLPIPPLAEQHHIVAEVERRLSVADELEKTIVQCLT